MSEIDEVVSFWEGHLATFGRWEEQVKGIVPKVGGCGLVYELEPLPERPNESFAIADMRDLELAEPHKHINGEVEIYFVLQGVGRIAVGDAIIELAPGVSVVTPPDTVHITLPVKDLVLAVINTPPFEANNVVSQDPTDPKIATTITSLQSN
jgi:mannose-6-phosphate isomerase-like protein (cupin superfamily)